MESHRPSYDYMGSHIVLGRQASVMKCEEASEYRVSGQGRKCGVARGTSVGSQGMQILKASQPREYQVGKHKSTKHV